MSDRQVIQTDDAPAAIGPYNQAIVANGMVYTAGQIPLDPVTGTLVGDGDAVLEAEQVLKNLTAVLAAAGSGLDHVVRCDVFLASLGDFQAVNEVYGRYFGDAPPARVTIEASKLPMDVRVEIAATAVVP